MCLNQIKHEISNNLNNIIQFYFHMLNWYRDYCIFERKPNPRQTTFCSPTASPEMLETVKGDHGYKIVKLICGITKKDINFCQNHETMFKLQNII